MYKRFGSYLNHFHFHTDDGLSKNRNVCTYCYAHKIMKFITFALVFSFILVVCVFKLNSLCCCLLIPKFTYLLQLTSRDKRFSEYRKNPIKCINLFIAQQNPQTRLVPDSMTNEMSQRISSLIIINK